MSQSTSPAFAPWYGCCTGQEDAVHCPLRLELLSQDPSPDCCGSAELGLLVQRSWCCAC